MNGKAGFITGSSSGIGMASAIEFAKEGAKVVVVAGNNLIGAKKTVEIIERNGGIASVYQCDISKEEEIKALVNETIERYGKLDFAHLNAGITSVGQPLAETDSKEWVKLININLLGTYFGLKHTIKALLKFGGGAIVVTSSVAGFEGGRYQSSYITSKFALNGMIKCAALEYANQNIRINAINPGATSTPMVNDFLKGSKEYTQAILDKQPSGAIATPENCAKAAVWLCADFNDQITGITMPIDGGFSAGKF